MTSFPVLRGFCFIVMSGQCHPDITHVYIAILGLGYSIGGIVHPNFQAEFLSSVECESN